VIAAELSSLLEPLERFESIRRRAARLGDRLADLSYANPQEGARTAARDAIVRTLADERDLDLQYAPFGGQTLSRRAAADALAATHGLPFAFRDIILTPGAMSALHLALREAGDPGDEVVVPVPCWLDYPLYVRALGMVPRMVGLAEPRFDLDVDAVAGALTDRTCAVILCHPANPTGRNHRAKVLADLGDALTTAEQDLGRRVTLIADEAHRDFVRQGEFTSAVTCHDRTVIVYSFGKYHFMQGQRLGYVAVSPRHPARATAADELARWSRITGVATPTALMQRALPRLLRLEHDLDWLAESRAGLLDALADGGYETSEPEATLFLYVRTPAGYDDDFAFIDELASRGVLALPAPVFHHEGWFRISLTGTESMLEKALAVFGAPGVAT
jgi:aspartate aminotransferase